MFHTSRSANTETWKYNAKGEVVAADHSTINAFDRSFEFDGIGNRKKSADSLTLPATDNYTSNALNQLEAVGATPRVHDADGNLTDNNTHLYNWDAENRLIEIKLKSDNSTVATYAYDYKSRRITKTVGSTETNFVYNGWNPIAEFTGTTLSKSYTWGMDLSGSMQGAGGVGGLLSVNDGSATYYPTFDGNGNVSEYVDATGAVVAHYEYDAFGQVVGSGAKANDFTHQFSTKQLDFESGLHYYGYRYYSAETGNWISRDPLADEDFLSAKINRLVDDLHKNLLSSEEVEQRINILVESGFRNLQSFVSNDPLASYDLHGLCEIHENLEPSSCSNWTLGHLVWRQITRDKADPATLHWDDPCGEGLVITNVETTDKPTPGSGNVTKELTMAVETRYALANFCHIGMGSAMATITCCCEE